MATKVVIAPNIKREREMIDKNGNIIDQRTKQIITPVENYVAPIPPPQPIKESTATNPNPPILPTTQSIQIDPLSIQEQIRQVKENLKGLEELKKLKIKELKAQASMLEKE